MPTVVTAGELLVELMRPERGVPLNACDAFEGPFPSGAPAIFIDAAARLGVESGIIGTVGDDAFGDVILDRLIDDGVDTSQVRRTAERTTGTAFVTYFDDDTREFLFHLADAAAGQVDPDAVSPGWLDDCAIVHVSGSAVTVNEEMAHLCDRLVALARGRGARVSVDPNVRPALLDGDGRVAALHHLLARADIVTPTTDELASLVPSADTEAARANHLLDRGADLVAVTEGADGCTLYRSAETVTHPGFTVTAVDPTGAGDAFAAGLVAATLEDRTLQARAAFANAVAAHAVASFGPMEGLPDHPTAEAMLTGA